MLTLILRKAPEQKNVHTINPIPMTAVILGFCIVQPDTHSLAPWALRSSIMSVRPNLEAIVKAVMLLRPAY